MRLNNYISSTGLCSRREADKLIEQGRVTVNGKKAQVGQTVEEGAMVKVNNKLIKPKNNNGNGEIIETEAPIHKSNVMLVDPKTKKPTKVRIENDNKGKKIRISKRSNEKID